MADIEKFEGLECLINVEDIIKDSCIRLVDKIKANALAQGLVGKHTVHYVDGWTWGFTKRGVEPEAIVHNETKYQLSHLLEHGHDVKRKKNGEKVGEADAHPHIKDAYDSEKDVFITKMGKAELIAKIQTK